MPYQLLCSDIDGTLLDKNRFVSQETINAFAKITGLIPVILASSRMPSAMRYIQDALGISGSPLICYNGGLILGSDGKLLQSNPMDMDVLTIIFEHQEKHDYNCSVYCDDIWYTGSNDEWTQREVKNTRVQPEIVPYENLKNFVESRGQLPHKIMCMGQEEEIQSLEDALGWNFRESINLYRSKPTYLEISTQNINKSSALKFLLDTEYGLKMEDVIAFGDNHNDVELIRDAGMGVAVGNATHDVLKVADFKSPLTNKQHALADAIRKFFIQA